MESKELQTILEALLFTAGKPLSIQTLNSIFEKDEDVSVPQIKEALKELQEQYTGRGMQLKEIASGFQFFSNKDCTNWCQMLLEEKPGRYSKALLETLALIAYRQPITRGEIEEIRGVSVSPSIFKTLDDRGWVKVVGHRDVPGKPGLYATTKQFLDYFGVKRLEDLPTLPEIMAMNEDEKDKQIQQELNLEPEEETPVVEENEDVDANEEVQEASEKSEVTPDSVAVEEQVEADAVEEVSSVEE